MGIQDYSCFLFFLVLALVIYIFQGMYFTLVIEFISSNLLIVFPCDPFNVALERCSFPTQFLPERSSLFLSYLKGYPLLVSFALLHPDPLPNLWLERLRVR